MADKKSTVALRQCRHGELLLDRDDRLADRFASLSEAKMELFDYIEVSYNQRRRHSTLGPISPAGDESNASFLERVRRYSELLPHDVVALEDGAAMVYARTGRPRCKWAGRAISTRNREPD